MSLCLCIKETETWLYLYDGDTLVAKRVPTDQVRWLFEEIVQTVNAAQWRTDSAPDDEWVLVTLKSTNNNLPPYVTQAAFRRFEDGHGGYWCTRTARLDDFLMVLGWQPLPEPMEAHKCTGD